MRFALVMCDFLFDIPDQVPEK